MHLLIPAAGMGKRMGSDPRNEGLRQRNKLFLTVLGKPILAWTLLAAEAATSIDWIGIIAQPADREFITNLLRQLPLTKPIEIIMGGDSRQESVYNGLQALPLAASHVLIHDGARCLATTDLFDRCALALKDCDGLVAAVPVKDTIKIVDDNHTVTSTPDRAYLWAAQTPQGFRTQLLKDCHERGRQLAWEVTDDAALFERCGLPVKIVLGAESNLKVTTPADLPIAEFLLSQRFAVEQTNLDNR
jgi:2-C-methyl-D-erythritol 4-phosphate cytidylyltransferase